MEQKTFYVAPEAKLRTASIRCSILVGSNTQTTHDEETPTEANVNNPGFGWGDARVRKDGRLGF